MRRFAGVNRARRCVAHLRLGYNFGTDTHERFAKLRGTKTHACEPTRCKCDSANDCRNDRRSHRTAAAAATTDQRQRGAKNSLGDGEHRSTKRFFSAT